MNILKKEKSISTIKQSTKVMKPPSFSRQQSVPKLDLYKNERHLIPDPKYVKQTGSFPFNMHA